MSRTVADRGDATAPGSPTAPSPATVTVRGGPAGPAPATVTVRYFAAAAEAAGVANETLTAVTAGELRSAMVEAHGAGLERVLTRCSLLADGTRLDADDAPLRTGVTVDVLPPFAGG